jgi:hypothetical protein
MLSPHSIVHLIVARQTGAPREVRWYVRHVWWSANRQGARDRVVASGRFELDLSESPGTAAIMALELALGQLTRERDERESKGTQ